MQADRSTAIDPIVLVTGKLTGGGQERVIVTLANAWVRRGRSVTLCIIAPGQATVPEYECDSRVQRLYLEPPVQLTTSQTSRQHRLRRSSTNLGPIPKILLSSLGFESLARLYVRAFYYWLNRRRIRKLREVLVGLNPTVVLSFGIFANLHTLYALERHKVGIVISERNDPSQRKVPFPMFEMREAYYNAADIVTANSIDNLQKLEAYVDRKKLVYVPNPLYSVWTQPHDRSCLHVDAPTILISARLVEQKNHQLLLKAFAALPERLAHWRLAVIGEGLLLEDLQQQAIHLRIAERVDWYGHITIPQMFYEAADIFVLPSLYEGQSNALLEAMYAKMPVVVSDIPSHAELIDQEQNGLRFSLDDPDSLTAALVRLIDDPHLRRRLGEAAAVSVAVHEIDRILPLWEHVLERAHYYA